MKTTRYFRESVRKRRPTLQDKWIEAVLADPEFVEEQDNGRLRHWRLIVETGTEADGETVHNAFFEQHFDPEERF